MSFRACPRCSYHRSQDCRGASYLGLCRSKRGSMGLGRRGGEQETSQAAGPRLIERTHLVFGHDANTQYRLARRLDYRGLFRSTGLLRRTSRAGAMRTDRIQSTRIPRNGAAVRSTILRGPLYGAHAMTGKVLSTNSLGPSTLTVDHIPSSHPPLCIDPVVAHRLSCHVLPHGSSSWQSPPRAEN